MVEIGVIITHWAHIEQDMILHASALASKNTDGTPEEYLRMDFKRLREKWFDLCRANFSKGVMDKVVTPLNSRLAHLSKGRGTLAHGVWFVVGRGKYRVQYWEQKTSLERFYADVTAADIREISAVVVTLKEDFERFCSGKT
jgi:hypothetical protein